ncbi:MAG: hypothetical protein HYX65_09490 [Gemmatimonadetes bacterium]|nr:hypothetical protein [Gemmatimonadota bacterium]
MSQSDIERRLEEAKLVGRSIEDVSAMLRTIRSSGGDSLVIRPYDRVLRRLSATIPNARRDLFWQWRLDVNVQFDQSGRATSYEVYYFTDQAP